MIIVSRTITCDSCGNWVHIEDNETPAKTRQRLRRSGWRTERVPGRRKLRDVCPHPPPMSPA